MSDPVARRVVLDPESPGRRADAPAPPVTPASVTPPPAPASVAAPAPATAAPPAEQPGLREAWSARLRDPAFRAGMAQFAATILNPQRGQSNLGSLGSALGAGGEAIGRHQQAAAINALNERRVAAAESSAESQRITAEASAQDVSNRYELGRAELEASANNLAAQHAHERYMTQAELDQAWELERANLAQTYDLTDKEWAERRDQWEAQVKAQVDIATLDREQAREAARMQVNSAIILARADIGSRERVSRAELDQRAAEFRERLKHETKLVGTQLDAAEDEYRARFAHNWQITMYEEKSDQQKVFDRITAEQGIAEDRNATVLLGALIDAEATRVESESLTTRTGEALTPFSMENVSAAFNDLQLGLKDNRVFMSALENFAETGEPIAMTDERVAALIGATDNIKAQAMLSMADPEQVAAVRARVGGPGAPAATVSTGRVEPASADTGTAAGESTVSSVPVEAQQAGGPGAITGDEIAMQIAALPLDPLADVETLKDQLPAAALMMTGPAWAQLSIRPAAITAAVGKWGEEVVRAGLEEGRQFSAQQADVAEQSTQSRTAAVGRER